jgi:putative ABC transport system substrate-binding protein
MRRREFIALLGGAVTSWPNTARAQQIDRARRIGVLMAFNEGDARARSWLSLFDEELAKLGWSGNRKPQTDVRWQVTMLNVCERSQGNW